MKNKSLCLRFVLFSQIVVIVLVVRWIFLAKFYYSEVQISENFAKRDVATIKPGLLSNILPADSKKIKDVVDREWSKVEKYVIPYELMCHRDCIRIRPVLLTAFDHSHFTEGKRLIRLFNQKWQQSHQLIVYDLGLFIWQKVWVKRLCSSSCGIRKFDTKTYPPHVSDLSNYSFKAVLLQEALRDFGHVMWIDSSFTVEDNTSNFDNYSEMNKNRTGLTVWIQHHLDQPCFIHPGMFQFFDEKPEDFLSSRATEGGAMLIYNDPETYKHLVLPWLVCALLEKCIAPPDSSKSPCNFENKFTTGYCCHRYDQAAMGLILARTFHFNSSLYHPVGEKLHSYIYHA